MPGRWEEINRDSNSSEEPVLEQGRRRQCSLARVSGIWRLQCNPEPACFWGVSRAIFLSIFSGHLLDFCLVYKLGPSNFPLYLWGTQVSQKIHFLPFLTKICLHFWQPKTLNFFAMLLIIKDNFKKSENREKVRLYYIHIRYTIAINI